MDMAEDMRPNVDEMSSLAERINIMTEMVISLQERRKKGEISHSEYINGLNMIERLAK